MQVSDLKAGQGKVDIEVKVKSKGEIRSFNKFGKELRVCNVIVSDASGETTMSLWNDDIEKVKDGDTLKITNGYVSEFNGQKQLTAGKFGKMEIVGASAESNEVVEKPVKKIKKTVTSEPSEVEF
ncbi:MAG: SOSS complex subunit B family protein [Nanoarchaeota archaeon]